MKVLHVCSQDAAPMRNIIELYRKTLKKNDIHVDISFGDKPVEEYDLVHGHYALTKAVIQAHRRARKNDIPFVLHHHGSDVRSITAHGAKKLPLHHRWISGRMRKKSDLVLLSTPDLTDWANGLYIPNPVDTELFRPIDKEKTGKTLLMGRFTKTSGIKKIIDPKQKYDCINWGDDIDFPNNVNELPFTPHDELPQVLNRYEKMIGPLVDPVSLARLEAMACGLKTYTRFPKKYIGYYGFENPDKVKHPRKFVQRYHDPDKIADLITHLYRSLI